MQEILHILELDIDHGFWEYSDQGIVFLCMRIGAEGGQA
jgi:hypothetical protein